MQSRWNANEAAKLDSELARRVYSSQLLGRDHTLVLHGGGNTSVKIIATNIFGESEELLYIKGSGWDLETITVDGFSAVRMSHVLKLANLDVLSDPQMMNELSTCMTQASAPAPSVETILHAILPYRFVDHTHADAVLTITNSPGGEQRIRDIYGKDTVIIPYVMPGFDLARLCAQRFPTEAHQGTIGMVLMHHGIFSFGATAEESYQRMIALVGRAESHLAAHSASNQPAAPSSAPDDRHLRLEIGRLRRAISDCAQAPMLLLTDSTPTALSFARRGDVDVISQQGPATPDHVLRTKRVPMIGGDVVAYAKAYGEYFCRNAPASKEAKTMLDPAPRVVIDPRFGMGYAGRTAKEAGIVSDLYTHTIDIIVRATALGGWHALPEKDIFDVEYWDLEQAKLKRSKPAAVFAGEVALITGAASGIGKACAKALLGRGAAVVGLDVNPDIAGAFAGRGDFLGVCCDLASGRAITDAVEAAVRAFGGIDMMVLNAGIFPPGSRIDALQDDEWRRVMQINVDANVVLMRECHPLLAMAPRGGRVVIIGSKNVSAPGPGAAAYSASKAALTQLARIAALEWGADNIRVNTVHPNAVFDTGIWTDQILTARAKQYGMSVRQYKTNNVLKTEITSRDVAELTAEMCGPSFAKTTGAQIPIDGGNDRVI